MTVSPRALLFAALVLSSSPALAQFRFNDPDLVKGEVAIDATEEIVQYRDDGDGQKKLVVKRSVTNVSASAPVLVQPVERMPDERIKLLQKQKQRGQQDLVPMAVMLTGSSFSRTWGEKDTPGVSTPPPISNLTYKNSAIVSERSPCKSEDTDPLVETQKWSTAAVARRLFVVEAKANTSLKDYRVCARLTGLDRQKAGSVTTEKLELDPESSECATKWNKTTADTDGQGLNIPFGETCSGATDADVVVKDGDTLRELHEPRIPAEVLNAWLKSPSSPRVFSLPFTEKYVTPTEERTVRGTLTLRLGDTSKKLEMSFVGGEDAYEKWLPTAEYDPNYQPARIHLALTEHGTSRKEILSVRLKDVSQYDGDCTNFPLPGTRKSEPDLYIPKSASNLQNFDFDSDGSAHTKTEVSEVDLEVGVRDYGAFGRLVAWTAMGTEGQNKYTQQSSISLPRDENDNRIADGWEKHVGIWDQHATGKEDADELPKGQKRSGDGLTVFEEYRGFMGVEHLAGKADDWGMPKFGHVRTNPKHKDVFLLDQTGKFTEYYADANPAELSWHLVDKTQMILKPIRWNGWKDGTEPPDNRSVNFNSPSVLRRVTQRGLLMVFFSKAYPTWIEGKDDGTVAAAQTGPDLSLDRTWYVWIRDENAFRAGRMKDLNAAPIAKANFSEPELTAIAKNLYENTIIHELGHALGIAHHCHGVRTLKTAEGKTLQFTCANQNAPDVGTISVSMHLAAGGVQSCALRYSYVDPKEFTNRTLVERQVTYCRKTDTYVDDLGKTQPSDNCFGQIDVSCAP